MVVKLLDKNRIWVSHAYFLSKVKGIDGRTIMELDWNYKIVLVQIKTVRAKIKLMSNYRDYGENFRWIGVEGIGWVHKGHQKDTDSGDKLYLTVNLAVKVVQDLKSD